MTLQEARDLADAARWNGQFNLFHLSHGGKDYTGLTETELATNLYAGRADDTIQEADKLPEEGDTHGGEGIADGPEKFKVSTIDITTNKPYGGPQPHVTESRPNFQPNTLKEDCSTTASACLPKGLLKKLDATAKKKPLKESGPFV